MASATMSSSSSSSKGLVPNVEREEMNSASSSRGDHPLDPTDPFSFFNGFPSSDVLPGIPDASTGEMTQDNSTIPTSNEGSWIDWPITSTVDNEDIAGVLPAQPDLSMMSFNDFNSMDVMGDLPNFDPMLFSDDILSAICSMEPSSAAPTNPPISSFDTDNFLNMMYPMNVDGSSSSSSLSMQSPVEGTLAAPMPEHVLLQQVPPPRSAEFTGRQEIEELTARARQVVGLSTASSAGVDTELQPSKLPIPRLQRPTSTTGTSRSNTGTRTSSVPPSCAQAGPSPSPSSGSTNSRTKLPHCTVERRYRTNMKEHLRNLREVVPALRVLELKSGNRISNLSLKPGTRRVGIDADADAEGADVIDERGFIDGVKVAHNGSKTTLVLKTIEYVRVLKRRELRLKREQEGLKALVRSFAGGPELLQQWETMWREKFGGPEKDEVDGADGKAGESFRGDEHADTMDDGEDEPSMSGRENRKRPRADSSSSVLKKGKKAATVPVEDQTRNAFEAKKYVPIMPAQASLDSRGVKTPAPAQPEKRKRGRPRKAPLPPTAVPNSLVQEALVAQQQQQSTDISPAAKEENVEGDSVAAQSESPIQAQRQESQSGQYLLAVFAFFSFFNSPLPFSSTSSFGVNRNAPPTYARSGSVMVGPRLEANASRSGDLSIVAVTLSWRDAIQLAHLAFSVFLFFSIMRPRLLRVARLVSKFLYSALCGLHTVANSLAASSAPESLSVKKRPDPSMKYREGSRKLREQSEGRLLTPAVEMRVFRETIGFKTGIVGLLLSLMRLIGLPERHDCWMMERRVYIRIAELVALDANTSIIARLQIFIGAFQFNYGCSYSATEIASMALVVQPIWHDKGAALWESALSRVRGRGSTSPYIYKAYDTFVLESMSINEATLRISRLDRNAGARFMSSAPHDGVCKGVESKHRELASPLAVLARQAIHDYVRSRAERLFLQTVSAEQDDCACSTNDMDSENLDGDRILAAGRSLDPHTVTLVNLFDQVCNSKTTHCDIATDTNGEREALDEWGDTSGVRAELQSLLEAIVLYRRIFSKLRIGSSRGADAGRRSSGVEISSTVASPSSPSRRNAAQHLALKRCLDSAAFNRSDALKNARSRVVDMLTAERS